VIHFLAYIITLSLSYVFLEVLVDIFPARRAPVVVVIEAIFLVIHLPDAQGLVLTSTNKHFSELLIDSTYAVNALGAPVELGCALYKRVFFLLPDLNDAIFRS
jgi:hypothetical protein